MTDIPEDVMEAARDVARKVLFEAGVIVTPENLAIAANAVVIALKAERGRCEAAILDAVSIAPTSEEQEFLDEALAAIRGNHA